MADTKITALTALTGADPANDVIPIVDVSDTTMAASGTTKKISVNNILGASGTATLASATITGDLTVDTSTLKVDSTNNRVGVGTATPTVPLDVVGIGGARFNRGSANQYKLQIGNSNKQYGLYVDLNANNTDYFGIYDDTAAQLMLTYIPGVGGSWTHYVNGSTAMTLNSTGLGIKGSPISPLTAYGATVSKAPVMLLTTVGSPDYGWDFSVDGAVNGNLFIRRLVAGTKTDVLEFDRSNGNVGIGVTPAGTGGCLQLKSGITFPATQVASSDANTLDDYEEGTFTPAITGSTTAGTATYVGRSGKYTKIGNLVQVQIFIDYNSHTGTGDTRITGLPFTNAGNFSAATVGYANGLALTAGNYVQAYVDASQSFILLNQAPTGGGSNTTVPIDPAATLVITATYTV